MAIRLAVLRAQLLLPLVYGGHAIAAAADRDPVSVLIAEALRPRGGRLRLFRLRAGRGAVLAGYHAIAAVLFGKRLLPT